MQLLNLERENSDSEKCTCVVCLRAQRRTMIVQTSEKQLPVCKIKSETLKFYCKIVLDAIMTVSELDTSQIF